MKQPESIAARYVLYFNESLRGLSVGAPVTLLGLPAGEVTEVGLDIDPATLAYSRARGDRRPTPSASSRAWAHSKRPSAKPSTQSAQQRHASSRRLVEQRGLRAQLRSGNLLTGSSSWPSTISRTRPRRRSTGPRTVPELPVVPSTLPDLEAKLSGILAKLDKLPLEAIGADLTKALASLDQTLKDASKAVNRVDTEVMPELKTTLEELRRMIATADGVLKNTDATLLGKDAPAQQDLRDALQEVTRAARSLRVLTDYLERHPESLIRGKSGE